MFPLKIRYKGLYLLDMSLKSHREESRGEGQSIQVDFGSKRNTNGIGWCHKVLGSVEDCQRYKVIYSISEHTGQNVMAA